MAAYTICGIVGLALHYPFRNCELEGSIIDIGVLKQAQLTGNDNYYTDPKSGNFYSIIKYSSIKDNLVAKHTKQIAYYKPTEEKFMKVALEVAKVMLKVKIIN